VHLNLTFVVILNNFNANFNLIKVPDSFEILAGFFIFWSVIKRGTEECLAIFPHFSSGRCQIKACLLIISSTGKISA